MNTFTAKTIKGESLELTLKELGYRTFRKLMLKLRDRSGTEEQQEAIREQVITELISPADRLLDECKEGQVGAALEAAIAFNQTTSVEDAKK
jgi:hypothetical protein